MSLIEIRPPVKFEEYEQACELVETVYYQHGMTERQRLSHPKANFVAVQNGQVVGSVGFRSGDQGQLPVEYLFGFEVEQLCSCPRDAVFEIVKLAVRERAELAVFRGLIAACARYAFAEHAYAAGLAIVKPVLERAINCLLHIPSLAPVCQLVKESGQAESPIYFLGSDPPHPICFARGDYPHYGQLLLELIKGKAVVNTHCFDHRRDYSLPSSYPQQPRIEREVVPAGTVLPSSSQIQPAMR